MNRTMQELQPAASESPAPATRPRQAVPSDRVAEGRLQVHRYAPALGRGRLDEGADDRARAGTTRPAGASLAAAASDLPSFRPLLVILGSAAGWTCGPAGYDISTLAQALADCESIVILAGACSEILYHGVARCASGHRKTVLIEAAQTSVGAWLSAVRRHAPRTAQVTVEPDEAAFGSGRTSLARA